MQSRVKNKNLKIGVIWGLVNKIRLKHRDRDTTLYKIVTIFKWAVKWLCPCDEMRFPFDLRVCRLKFLMENTCLDPLSSEILQNCARRKHFFVT